MTFLHWRWEETYLQFALWYVGTLEAFVQTVGAESPSAEQKPRQMSVDVLHSYQKKQYCFWDAEGAWRNSLIIFTGKVKWCAGTIFYLFCKHLK